MSLHPALPTGENLKAGRLLREGILVNFHVHTYTQEQRHFFPLM